MRRLFKELLYDEMKVNEKVYLVTADLGYKMFDRIKADFPDRFINCGSAEQLMVGIASGLAYEGKIPVCYSITPFLLCRPFEIIRNHINKDSLPVKLVGSGIDDDYSHDGFTHWAGDTDKILFNCFPNIRYETYLNEYAKELLKDQFSFLINNNKPVCIILKR